MYNMLSEWFMA